MAFVLTLEAIQMVFTPINLLMAFVAVTFGLIMGAVPGLTATMAVALSLPLTFMMGIDTAFTFLMAVYVAGITGGKISAILLRIPGTPSSVATTFDGYPMARNGEPERALGIALGSSAFGTIVGILCLLFIAPPLARFALAFGPFEYTMVGVFALTIVSLSRQESLTKAFIATVIGMMAGMVGLSQVDSVPRFTFGRGYLLAGFEILPVLLGLYAVTQILLDAEKSSIKVVLKTKLKGLFRHIGELWGHKKNAIRSALMGVGIGIIPGIGGALSNIMAYLQAKKASAYPEKFGTGIPDGIIASETANNASIGGALIPLLTLGIPGDGVSAMLLGAFMIHGLQPGPLLFRNNPGLVYGMLLAMVVAVIFIIIQMVVGVRLFAKVLGVPKYFLLPVVFTFCVLGALTISGRLTDVGIMLAFGLLGFFLYKNNYPLIGALLGYILGPIIEYNLRRALMLSRGSFMPYITRPISATLVGMTLLVLLIYFYRQFAALRRNSGGSGA